MAKPDQLPMTADRQALRAMIAHVAQDLVSAEMVNGRFVVQMPIATATGSQVQVSVWAESADSLIVSDDGGAYHQIVTACASERTFSRIAAAEAAVAGAVFDGGSLLLLRVPTDRLRGAIIVMASMIRTVVDRTIEASFAERDTSLRDEFVSRAIQAFRDWDTSPNGVLRGQSSAQHEFDLVATQANKVVAIEFFTPAASSFNATFTKMSDLYRLDDDVRRIAVTPSLQAVGSKLVLINSVAHIRPANVDADDLRRIAA